MANSTRSGVSSAKEVGKEQRQKDRVEVIVNGVPVKLSPVLENAVNRAHKGLLADEPKEMTTTQAAEFLDVSRPFVIKLVKRGELSCRMVGSHRRIPTSDLVSYREKMFIRAKEAVDEITRISEESGLTEANGHGPARG